MRRSLVAVSLLGVLVGSPASAQPVTSAEFEALKRMMQEVLSQNEDLRKRVRELEEAVGKQGPPAREPAKGVAQEAPKEPAKEVAQDAPKDAAAAAATEPISAAKAPWGRIQLGGALELEAGTRRSFKRVRTSDFLLATAEFDFEANVLDWAKAELSFEWDRGEDKVTLNEAFVIFGRSGIPVELKAGRGVAPFGISSGSTVAARLEDTLTLKGPLTTDIFEAKEDHILLSLKKWGVHVGGYVYNGTTNRVGGGGKRLEHYGFTAGYEIKTENVSFVVGAGWIDSVFDTDGLTDAFSELQESRRGYVPGVALNVRLGLWGFSFIAEYITALHHARIIRTLDNDDVGIFNVRPEAWQVEAGYTTDIFFDIKSYLAVSYSRSASLLAAFPKRRFLATIGTWLSDNMRLAAEYNEERDYSKVQLGTGRKAESWLLRLTYEW